MTEDVVTELYKMRIHETQLFVMHVIDSHEPTPPGADPAYPMVWQVTRVATGWIYQDATKYNHQKHHYQSFFIPLTYPQSDRV